MFFNDIDPIFKNFKKLPCRRSKGFYFFLQLLCVSESPQHLLYWGPLCKSVDIHISKILSNQWFQHSNWSGRGAVRHFQVFGHTRFGFPPPPTIPQHTHPSLYLRIVSLENLSKPPNAWNAISNEAKAQPFIQTRVLINFFPLETWKLRKLTTCRTVITRSEHHRNSFDLLVTNLSIESKPSQHMKLNAPYSTNRIS